MKAVIMAGGRGTRLASVLSDSPKPMVSINGKPLLQHQVESLCSQGFDDILMIIGHLGEKIKNYFGDGSNFGARISYFEEDVPLGTAGAFYHLKDQVRDGFLLLFGDVFQDVDYSRMIRYHSAHNSEITLFVHPNSHPYDSDIVITGEDMRIIGWSGKKDERPDYLDNLVNAGIYVFSRSALDLFVNDGKCDLEKDVIRPSISSRRVYAYRSSEYVKDIGTPERLSAAESDICNGICHHRNLKNKQKCIFIDRDGTINRLKGFLKSAEDFELESGVSDAIRRINASEYLAIVVTNQPVIARGECTLDELNRIHRKMQTLLGNEGAYVDGIFFCPHHPDGGFEGEIPELKFECDCRKPKTGMLDAAAESYNIDLSSSWMVGDATTDVQTGINAGTHTVLLRTGLSGTDGKFSCKPDLECNDLIDCVNQIFNFDRLHS